jgi:ribonuclease P protein component
VRIASIKKNWEFQTVYKKGKSLANKHIVMFVFKNDKGINRLGISASKKIGKAVVRNKQRRRLKEAFRILGQDILTGYDIVILPRADIIKADFSELKSSTKHLLRKHRIWRQNG